MPNVNMFARKPSNTSYQPDTRNLGYSGVSAWGDSSPQNSDPKFNFGGGGGSGNAFGGGVASPPASAPNPILKNYMSQQSAENRRSRGANEGRWNEASGYLKQFATPFDPAMIERMKAQNAMTAQGGENNAFREQQGIMAASGQGDASSLAAAASEAHRHALGARVMADNELGIKANQANNAAGMQVGSTILGNLPQDRPDDYSGYASLGLMDQNNQFNRSMTQNIMDRPTDPGATNQRPFMGGAGGVNPFGVSYDPNGVPQRNPWGNGLPNGNALTPTMPQPQMGAGAGGGWAPDWKRFLGR